MFAHFMGERHAGQVFHELKNNQSLASLNSLFLKRAWSVLVKTVTEMLETLYHSSLNKCALKQGNVSCLARSEIHIFEDASAMSGDRI